MKKADRQKVFEKYGGRCAYCGRQLDEKFQVDHAISKCYWFYHNPNNKNAVNDFSNLMPSCAICNHYKRSHCLDSPAGSPHVSFRMYMMTFHKRLSKLPKTTVVERTKNRIEYMNRIAEAYGINKDIPFSGKFYFETYHWF